MIELIDLPYLDISNFNNILVILCIGYGFYFKWLFIFLWLLINIDGFLPCGCVEDRAPHLESYEFYKNPKRTI